MTALKHSGDWPDIHSRLSTIWYQPIHPLHNSYLLNIVILHQVLGKQKRVRLSFLKKLILIQETDELTDSLNIL